MEVWVKMYEVDRQQVLIEKVSGDDGEPGIACRWKTGADCDVSTELSVFFTMSDDAKNRELRDRAFEKAGEEWIKHVFNAPFHFPL